MIENIKERMRAAEYATQCMAGHGAFGTTESQMIATFLEHALLDMRYLMDRYTEMEERAEKAERERDVLDSEAKLLRESAKQAWTVADGTRTALTRAEAEAARLREAMPTDEERAEIRGAVTMGTIAHGTYFEHGRAWLARLDAARNGGE